MVDGPIGTREALAVLMSVALLICLWGLSQRNLWLTTVGVVIIIVSFVVTARRGRRE